MKKEKYVYLTNNEDFENSMPIKKEYYEEHAIEYPDRYPCIVKIFEFGGVEGYAVHADVIHNKSDFVLQNGKLYKRTKREYLFQGDDLFLECKEKREG